MLIVPTGLLLMAIFGLALLRGTGSAFVTAIALIPLGTAAVLVLGGLSLIAAQLCFVAMLGIVLVRRFVESGNRMPVRLELSVFVFGLLVSYALVASLVLPRIFEGEIMVFSLGRDIEGLRMSRYFNSTLSPLQPGRGNISQPLYFILTFLVFATAISVAREKGALIIHRGIVAAASLNIALGALDLIGGDAILALFQTANYEYLTDVTLLGRARLSGGFAEASAFGKSCAVFTAYFLARFALRLRLSDLAILLGSLAMGLMSFSSTFFVSVAFMAGLGVLYGLATVLRHGGLERRALAFIVVAMISAMLAVGVLFATPVGRDTLAVLETLIFDKATSVSGLERKAWARRGLEIGIESYGLGIGLGSTRSNGLISVWAANLGLIGSVLFLYLYKIILLPTKLRFVSEDAPALFKSAVFAILTVTFTSVLSATTPDPGVIFAIMCALAVVSHAPIRVRFGNPAVSTNPAEASIATSTPLAAPYKAR